MKEEITVAEGIADDSEQCEKEVVPFMEQFAQRIEEDKSSVG